MADLLPSLPKVCLGNVPWEGSAGASLALGSLSCKGEKILLTLGVVMMTEKATSKGLHYPHANLSGGLYKLPAVCRTPTWMLWVYPKGEDKGLSLEPRTTQEGVCTNDNLIRLNEMKQVTSGTPAFPHTRI